MLGLPGQAEGVITVYRFQKGVTPVQEDCCLRWQGASASISGRKPRASVPAVSSAAQGAVSLLEEKSTELGTSWLS